MSEEIYQDPERKDLASASQMEMVVACPGQPQLVKNLPPEAFSIHSDEDQEAANKGTKIHKAFETGNANELDPEEYRIYENASKHTQLLLDKWIQDKTLDPAKIIEGPREFRVWLHNPVNYPQLIGSAKLDRHWLYKDENRSCLFIVDLKTGWNPNLSSPANSWQLKYQLITLWKEEYDNITDGRVAYARDRDKIYPDDWCDYEPLDLKYSFDSLVYHLWMSTQPEAPRRAGPHCRWCPGRNGYCPEAMAYSLLPSVVVKGVLDKKNVDARLDMVADADLLKIWRMGSIIRTILEAVTKRLKGLPEERLQELGLVLGPGRKTQEVTDIPHAFSYLLEVVGWPEDKIWACLKFVNERMINVLGEKGMDEKAAKAWLKENLKTYSTTKESDKILREL